LFLVLKTINLFVQKDMVIDIIFEINAMIIVLYILINISYNIIFIIKENKGFHATTIKKSSF
jgi:hypothetical protein